VSTRRSTLRRLANAAADAVFVVVLCIAIAACSDEPITETPFARTAFDAASTLSAASETLRQMHDLPPRLTVEYGKGAMINFAEQVAGVPEELPRLQGAPDPTTVDALVRQVEAAADDLEGPCLLDDCDWQSQVTRIDAAKQALLDAAQ
jgi:hypothetical protein